jgi:hypothetical protein
VGILGIMLTDHLAAQAIDHKARYAPFDVLQAPYPGVEFFREFGERRTGESCYPKPMRCWGADAVC